MKNQRKTMDFFIPIFTPVSIITSVSEFRLAKQHNVLNEDVDVEFELDYLFQEAQKGNEEVLQLLNILGEGIESASLTSFIH